MKITTGKKIDNNIVPKDHFRTCHFVALKGSIFLEVNVKAKMQKPYTVNSAQIV